MTNEETFKPEDGLALINTMINRAQNRFSENGFLFVFWGWLVFIAAITFYILEKMNVENSWYVWFSMPFGGIFTMIYSARQKKKEVVKSYIDDYVAYVATAFGIGLTITLTLGFKLLENCYPVVIMLYAIMTFTIGGILKYKPLIIGGVLSFPICVAAFFVNFEMQVLLLALSVLVSYIVPGHFLYNKARKEKHV